jgi:hypothetical protein
VGPAVRAAPAEVSGAVEAVVVVMEARVDRAVVEVREALVEAEV